MVALCLFTFEIGLSCFLFHLHVEQADVDCGTRACSVELLSRLGGCSGANT